MSNQPNNRPPIQPNPLDVMSTWLFAEPVAGATRRPNLRVRVVGNVPRIVVKTNVPEDKNNGLITFNTDLPTFAALFGKLQAIAEGRDDGSYTFEYNDDFVAGKKLDKRVTISSVKIGKDRETGKVYIAVLGYNRPKIQFFFGPSQYHALKRGDGSEIPEAEVSAVYAEGFVRAYLPLVTQLLVSEFNPDGRNVAKAPVPGQGGGGNQGNYQRRGGGGGGNYGGGGNRSNNSFDDDIEDFDF